MKSIFIILGNGFTIDFLNHFNRFMNIKYKKSVKIDVQNLFKYGELLGAPWDKRPGFLSYKICPSLWTLGARPYQDISESNALIEEIISCANMFFDFTSELQQKEIKQQIKRFDLIDSNGNKIYLQAYAELIVYLRCLFSWYNSLIDNTLLEEFIKTNSSWGWLDFFRNLNENKYKEIILVTYNYDIWLERILECLNINYSVYGFKSEKETSIEIIKPHGSISFVPNKHSEIYQINYTLKNDDLNLQDLKLEYNNLTQYSTGAIIPPAGDSTRLKFTKSWASILRNEAIQKAKKISNENNTVIMCGISYWHVDRREIDELLINLAPDTNFIFINPKPPGDLNAVLTTIFRNYVLQTSSDNIGGILND